MAKIPISNFIIIGTDGNVAIGTNKGQVSVIPAAKLSRDLVMLIKKRQELGKQLTAALARAQFPVALANQSWVFDLGEGTRPIRLKSKKRQKSKKKKK